MAKKNPWQALCLGGDPLKTRCAPHFHRFCFLLLFFLHSWHASPLAPLSFHASLSRLHTHACHFPTPTSEANLSSRDTTVVSIIRPRRAPESAITQSAVLIRLRAQPPSSWRTLAPSKQRRGAFILPEITRLCGPGTPGLLCHHRQKMTRSLMGGQREQHADDLKSS